MELKPGYKQTEVGVIPEDWDVVSIGDITSISVGRDVIESHFSKVQGGLFCYPVYSNTVDFPGIYGYYNFPEYEQECVTVVGRGVGLGTAFCRAGGFGAIGRLIVLKPLKENISRFLAYSINHDIDFHSESSGVPQLTGIGISKYKIALPQKVEQEAIAKALSDMDALIQSLEQQIIKKQQIKQGAMQSLLNPYDTHGQLKQGWSIKKLGKCVDIDPENLSSNTPPDYEFKYITLENAKNGVLQGYSTEHFETASPRARRVLKNGDVLIGTVRPNLKSHCIFMESTADWICSTGFAVIRCPRDLVSPYFVFASFFAPFIDRQIENLITGSNYPAISSGDVRALKFAAPEYEQQLQIEAVLSKLDSEITALKAKLKKLTVLKQGMMQNLLSGNVRLV
ncbi:restriction endonuclease subunit S [Endozoicomonas atrinae]|uniref:restriction endonuclease subunit S n=1 Tax=Endozoicomonas atrinae TaxID=1333660 RepID=UPI003B00C29E